LVVAPQPFYEDRGTPIAVRHVLEALSAIGHEVDLLTFPVGDDIRLPGLRILRVGRWLPLRHVRIGFSPRKLLLDVLLSVALWNRLRRRAYLCVHAVEEAVFPALVVARRRGVPVIYDMQSCMPDQLKRHPVLGLPRLQRWMNRCERWAFRRSDVVVCSAGLAPYVRDTAPSARAVEWTFPAQTGPVTDDEVRALRTACGLAPGVPVVLYAGNFAAYQGLASLAAAIPHVLADVPGAVFVMVGADANAIPEDIRRVQARVPEGAIRILPRQPREALPAYLAMADVLVSPRAGGDNLPLKIFDYMAAGRPIVATDYPIHRMFLNEACAVLVEPTAAALAEGIVRLLKDRPLAARLGAAARAYSDANFGPVMFRKLVADLYASATGRPPSTAKGPR